MAKPDPHLEEIAKKLDLTTEDLETIKQAKRRRKVQFLFLPVFESIIGIISFLSGFALAPSSEILSYVNYPYSQFLLVGNVSLLSQNKKIKWLAALVILTVAISLVGVVSGYGFGTVLKTTVVEKIVVETTVVPGYPPPPYGVYSAYPENY